MKTEPGRQNLIDAFLSEHVLDIETVKKVIGSTSRMTAFRKLKELGYYNSYSHHGKYYTLFSIPTFDSNGLWNYKGVHFSIKGSLIESIISFVYNSNAGYFASELEDLLHVFVHNALSSLHSSERLHREQVGNQYLYLSPAIAAKQLLERKKLLTERFINLSSNTNLVPVDIDEHSKLFLSTLNEKQRRLYLGLESLKIGHGGDVKIANASGVNVKTISRGRKELVSKDINPDRVRCAGAGRPPLKKTK
jgi:hypothetical protein